MGRLAMVTAGVVFGLLVDGRCEWVRHTIDGGAGRRIGADGVRLGDVNGDGLIDVLTGWEQSGEIRIYRNPGARRSKEEWPAVTVGRMRGVEDACFVDFDGDGRLDVLSCSEGRSRRICLHRAPEEVTSYFVGSAWSTREVAGGQSWMFAVPDGRKVYVGAKGDGAGVSFGALGEEAEGGGLALRRLVDVGWVMTLAKEDVDGDGTKELLVTDRKGARRGVWIIGEDGASELIGGAQREVMFADVGDLDDDGAVEIAVATRDGVWLVFEKGPSGWSETVLLNPMGTRWGKAVSIGDIDLDGRADIVMSFNTQAQAGHPGVVWATRGEQDWLATDISGPEGRKFDLVELLDLDSDGDLDVLTCEEADNLGVVWYENPLR